MIASNAFAATVDRKSLAEVLRVLGKVVERRNTIPILAHVMIEAGRGMLTLTGTDLDIAVSVDIPADCQPGTRVAVALAALTAAVNKSKAEHATLTDVGGAVVLAAGGTARLPTLPAVDFPVMVRGDLGGRFAVPVAQLRDDLARLRIAVSTEENRYYLNGVFMHRGEDGTLRMAATDGHRLARIVRPAAERMPDDFADSIVPRKTVDVLQFIMKRHKGRGDDVALAFSASKVDIRVGNYRVLSKLIDGTFPDYSRIIPSGRWGAVATVDAEGFTGLIDQATAHVTERKKAVNLSWRSGESWVTAYASDPHNGPGMAVGSGHFEATLDETAGDYVTCYNAAYLKELLGACTGEVVISQGDPARPALIEPVGAPEFVMVLMPMRGDERHRTPDDAKRLARTPVDILRDELPPLDGDQPDILKGQRKRRGAMMRAAIDHLAGSGDRRAARLAVLHLVAELDGDLDQAARVKRIAEHSPASTFRAWQDGLGEVQVLAPVEPVAVATSIIEAAIVVEKIDVEPGAVETPDEYLARVRAEGPMFRTVQDFKAAAGVGSRWVLQNWSPGEGWRGARVRRVRRVATVRARDIGFVDGNSSDDYIARVGSAKGFADRSWVGFPKSGLWKHSPDGLMTVYADGEPCMLISPAPTDVQVAEPAWPYGDAPEAEPETGQAEPAPAPAEPVDDDSAVLRAMVLELTARLDRLEKAAQDVAGEPGVSQGEALESSPARASADQAVDLSTIATRVRTPAHERAIRTAWAMRRAARGWRYRAQEAERSATAFMKEADGLRDRCIASEANADALRERAVDAEHDAKRRIEAALAYAKRCETDMLNMEARAEQSAQLARRSTRRIARQAAVLVGRNAQLARARADLGFARTLGAVLQRERDQAAEAQGGERSPVRLASTVTYAMGARKAG